MSHNLGALVLLSLLTAPLCAQSPATVAPPTPSVAMAACPDAGFDACAVRAEARFLGGTRIVRGGQGQPVGRLRGFGGSNLATLLAGSDSAAAHARRYTRAARTSGALAIVGGALFVAAAVVDLEDREVKDSGLILVGAGSAFGLGATVSQLAAQRSLARAVWWYNRDLAARRARP